MKIGFVNQPFDTIIPPGQNSVGYYTYGVACELAKSCKVIVYGLQADDPGSRAGSGNQNIDFRPLPSTRFDRLCFRARTKFGKLFDIKGPISTSKLLFPGYGRQVAIDLHEEAVRRNSHPTLFAIRTADSGHESVGENCPAHSRRVVFAEQL